LGSVALQLDLELAALNDDEGGDVLQVAKRRQEACFGGSSFDAEKDSFLLE
jgi:hypothetical protein